MRAAEWIGGTGETWAAQWRRTDLSFAGLDAALTGAILAAAPSGPARLVDIGCGAGATSLGIAAARPDVEIVGIDLSSDLIGVAARRRDEAGIANDRCRFVTGDAPTAVAALMPVDLFFSRHGVMFFDDPNAAFAAFADAAAPGTRFVFSCFAAPADNPWAGRSAAAAGAAAAPPVEGPPPPGPFAFANPDYVRSIFAATGWRAPEPARAAFRYVAGAGEDPVAEAVALFSRIGPASVALAAASVADRPGLLDRLAALCADHRDGDEVAFPAAAWIWSAEREKA